MNKSIASKLITAFILVGTIVVASMQIASHMIAKDAMLSVTIDRLEGIRALKQTDIERYFDTIRDQLLTFSENNMIVHAMAAFPAMRSEFISQNQFDSVYVSQMREDVNQFYRDVYNVEFQNLNSGQDSDWQQYADLDEITIAFQYQYISANAHPLGSKDLLNHAGDVSDYSNLHAQIHPIIRNYLQKFGYYDIFLIDINTGHIVYSVFKELDYQTSLLDGPYAETNFADVFRAASSLDEGDTYAFVDFEVYPPSYMAPASFIASPIFQDGIRIGVAVFQMPLDRINSIINARDGMGYTGETIISGTDTNGNTTLRNSRFASDGSQIAPPGSHIGLPWLDTENRMEVRSGVLPFEGKQTVFSSSDFNILGKTWSISIVQSYDEAMVGLAQMMQGSLVVAAIILILTGLLAFVIGKMISRPIVLVADRLKDISEGEGDLTKRLDVNSNDEVGKLALYFNTFVDKLMTLVISASQNADSVASSSTELSTTSTQISSNAELMSMQTSAVASALKQSSMNLDSISQAVTRMSSSTNSVAAAVEEMSASLSEVSRNCQKELQIAEEANKYARSSKEIMDKLGLAAKSIGNVVDVINNIADQTNLLAINATIEAASAGEAGKGFTVVANEVKELARQTAQATHQIQQQIEQMQSNTEDAVSSIDAVARVIDEVNVISQAIVTAVEEQSATVNEVSFNISGVSAGAEEISQNVAESVNGLNEISSNITEVNNGVTTTTQEIKQVKQSAHELSQLSEGLNKLLSQFKT
ncbi:MAG: methyl-accepting chemotaxis protein [Bacteroidetes bacterium]|nr:methyl-accepting chemotaxis protein [Bacteroidota bacterium]MCH8523147.1 methyl-accepting chemotaxis protein [Balneolales bacterium]